MQLGELEGAMEMDGMALGEAEGMALGEAEGTAEQSRRGKILPLSGTVIMAPGFLSRIRMSFGVVASPDSRRRAAQPATCLLMWGAGTMEKYVRSYI